MDDFVYARRGRMKAERHKLENEWVHFQTMGSYILGALGAVKQTSRNKKVSDIIPNIYEPQADGKTLKEKFEARREAAKKRTADLKKRAKIGKQLHDRGKLRRKPG